MRRVVPFLAAAALWLAPVTLHPTSVAFWRGGAYSDLLISHWPSAVLLHRSLFDAGRIPLWNPTILSGTPFAADPLSGLWYPPNWLAALFPAALSFNLIFLLHLAWAGWGAARLAGEEGAGGAGALVAGLSFAGAPKLIGHIGLGHLGLVEAVCWTPWLLIAARRATEAVADARRSWLADAARSGAILGVIFLADPRWSVPAGMVAIVYALAWIARSHKDSGAWPAAGRLVGGLSVSGAFALGISACLGVGLWEFSRLSTRATLTASERVAFALPWERLTTLVVPDFGAWPEWLAYAGIAVVLLAALAFAGNAPRALFWWAVALGGVLLALGPALPAYPVAASITPGLNLLRVPARFLFLTSLGVSMAAGLGMRAALEARRDARSRRIAGWIGVAVVACIVAVAAWPLVAGGGSSPVRARSFPAIAIAIVALAWLGLGLRGTVRSRVGAAGWIFLICADLATMSFAAIRVVGGDVILGDRADLAGSVARLNDGGRVASPSYSLHQPSAMIRGLELADGVNPLQIASYREFMSTVMGFSPQGYSVTLPPFPDGDPAKPWPVALDTRRLGLVGVTYFVSDFPVDGEGLVLESRDDGAYVYRNLQARPRAWMQPSPEATTWTPVDRLELLVDELRVGVTGPGELVLAEVMYPGWQATIDGRSAPIKTAYGILRAVQVPEGAHQVRFVFRPTSVYIGAALTLLTLLALVLVERGR